MPSVECRDHREPKAFSRRHDRTIDRSQREVAILVHQFGDAEPVTCHHRLNAELASGEVTEESHFGICTESGPDEVDHLGDHKGGDDQWARMREQQFERFGVVTIVGVDVGIERSGIDEQGYRVTSEARISSMR